MWEVEFRTLTQRRVSPQTTEHDDCRHTVRRSGAATSTRQGGRERERYREKKGERKTEEEEREREKKEGKREGAYGCSEMS